MKDWKYIAYLTLLVLLLGALFLSKSKQYDWTVTLSHEDKDPYGTYALHQLLPTVVNSPVINSYQTLYELKDSLSHGENIIVIASSFGPAKEDTEMLLNFIKEGGSALISANYFFGVFADTLGLTTSDFYFEGENTLELNDTTSLHFVSPIMDSTRQFNFRMANINQYISDVDSVEATTLVENDHHQPVTVKINLGKGLLLVNCTPMAFTNIHLLNAQNHEFASALLSYLPPVKTIRTEYYHVGRMETATPLRFVLTNEPLRWAYYLTIISLLLFMIFEAKRKQRIIPVIKPLQNSTLEFVATIGNLYFQQGDHKNIAEKKIQFFFEQIRQHYWVSTQHRDEGFMSTLIRKSGVPEMTVRDLMAQIQSISSKDKISAEELMKLNKALEKFNQKK